MPRPRKSERELKSEIIGVRFNREERQFVSGEANICGVSLSSLIREEASANGLPPKAIFAFLPNSADWAAS